jgi:hypothetical protein
LRSSGVTSRNVAAEATAHFLDAFEESLCCELPALVDSLRFTARDLENGVRPYLCNDLHAKSS